MQLLGARTKESSQPPSPQPSVTTNKLKKSSSFRGGGEREEDGGRGAKSDPKCSDSLSSLAKSPKLSRTESMTERTVQKITKVIRGTSRFVSDAELSLP